MATSKQITKTTQAPKAASKAAAKQAPKATPKAAATQAPKAVTVYAYAALLGEALTGKFGNNIARFYVNAIGYHKKQGTTFPRARIANETLLNDKDAREFLTKHATTSIPAGSKVGQRLFDAMMIETQTQAKAKA